MNWRSADGDMASITARKDRDGITVGWQARVRKKGQPLQVKTFDKKSQAQAWGRQIESEMDRGVFVSRSESEQTTLSTAIKEYIKDVIPHLRGSAGAISSLRQVEKFMGTYSLAALTPILINEYRDARLATVSPTTVRHDLACLSRLLSWLEKERQIHLPLGNVVRRIRLPRPNRGRERRLEKGEYERLMEAAVAYGGDMPHIIPWAIETGMRREKIINMRWEHVDWNKQVLTIPSLPGEKPVPARLPLSLYALSILQNVPRDAGYDGAVWSMSSPNSVSKAFATIRERAGIEGFRFHDLRHEATSRLFEIGLNAMEVSAITGHKTLEMLKRYTQLRPEDLARKLDRAREQDTG